MTDYFWFFVPLAAAMALQLWSASRQSKDFLAQVNALRAEGTVAVGLAGRRLVGRKAYVALASREGRVTAALVLRGLTTFARGRPAPALVGLTTRTLAGQTSVPGVDALERAAARQAARTLNASGGWQPTGGVEQGRESARPA
jgi:DNA-binding transcriptional regulator of glucitol operon